MRKRGKDGSVPHRSFNVMTSLVLRTIGSSSRGSITSPRKMRRFLSRTTVFSLRTGARSHASFSITF